LQDLRFTHSLLRMGFRFFKRIRICPGISVNLSKSGASLSLGPRGAKFTVGPRGARTTVGIPGTGLYYTASASGGMGRRARRGDSSAEYVPPTPVVRPEDRLTMGFFKRLITPDDEEALVDGARELALGDLDDALPHLRKSVHLGDGAFLAGFVAFKKELFPEAARHFIAAARKAPELGVYFKKYGITAEVMMPITQEVTAHIRPDVRGILLTLAEIYQYLKQWRKAQETLEYLLKKSPEDVVARLSLAEILMSSCADNKVIHKRVLTLSEGISNESSIHAALLLYRGRAMRKLAMPQAAIETLSGILKKQKGNPATDKVALAARYERALAYEDSGSTAKARAEFEKIYADDPKYEDVEKRLGL